MKNSEDNYQNLLETSIVNINGEILKAEQAKISVFDRGFLFGDSIYDVTYTKDGNIIFFEDHIDRIYNSARLLGMSLFVSRDHIIKETIKTLKHSKIKNAYVRIIITRGETDITLDPNTSFKNNLIIIVRPQKVHPKEFYENGINLCISSVLRNNIKAIDPKAKSGNYLNNVMAMSEAKNLGYDDALMVNEKNEITEGTSFNIWFVKNNVIKTPHEKAGLLKGITREKIISLCRKNQLNLQIDNCYTEEIESYDEAFISSSTRGLIPVRTINNKKFLPPNEMKIYQKLSTLYNELVVGDKNNGQYNYL